jgi:hypothetical protein
MLKWIFCLGLAVLTVTGLAAAAETRIGVVTTETAGTGTLAPLVELRLGQRKDVAMVERSVIQKVLAEQRLQAVLASDAPGKRAALGKMLKADLLVFVTERKQPKPHVQLVVCETEQGLRLCVEPVLLAGKPEANADAVIERVMAAAKKRQEKIVDIVAVPPLVNNSLTHDADQYQGAFARLVENALLRRPGAAVVELAEARAITQEMVVTSSAGVERHLPLYLMGDYRYDGAGEKRRAQFTWRLLRGEMELDRRHVEDLMPEKLADRLHEAAIGLVDKALGRGGVRLDPDAEARQLGARAREFLDLGAWQEALALSEASVLLKPDQPEVHGAALRAMLEIYDARECMKQRLAYGLSPPDALEAIQWLRGALPHLEAFFRGTKIGIEHHRYIYRRWGLFHLRELTLELREACLGLQRDMRETAERILAAKATARVPDNSLGFLWRWTEPPIEPPANEPMNFLWYLMEWHYEAKLKPAWETWLTKHLPEVCEHRLTLLRDFAWLTGERMNRYSGTCDSLIAIRQPGMGLPPLTTEPAYLEFLAQVEKLPDPTMQDRARRYQAEIRRQPQMLKEREERVKRYAQDPPRYDPLPPVTDPEVLFHPLTLKESFPDGQEKVFVCEERRRPPGESTPWRMIEAWIPAAAGCDLVYFGRQPTIAFESAGPKVVSVASELAVMKEKGHLRALPLRLTRSCLKTREGAIVAGGQDELINACWDGQYFWALNPGNEGPLAVVEPREEKIWKVGPEAGLPPSISCGIAPLGPGKVCIAGYFGRLWIALATFDGSRLKLEVIHEAHTVPEVGHRPDDNSPERHSPKLACPITFVSTVAAPANRPAAQRVVVGRLDAGPLLVDPETRSVTSAPYSVVTNYLLLSRDDAVYWQDGETAFNTGPLYRIGLPDFRKELVNRGCHTGACVFFEGRFHVINRMCAGYYVAPSLKEPWRGLRCEIPGKCWYPRLFVSNHYGLLLSTEQGVYAVELKKP